MASKIVEYIKHPSNIFIFLQNRCNFKILPDKLYLQICYKLALNKKLNLDNPQTFNEKLQWLKLHDRKPEYTMLVDKYEAKKYVAGIIGEEYIIPTIGIWDSFAEIDFDNLPNQFVLKCTHDSGGKAICRDKVSFDIDAARKKINKSLKRNYYYSGREWPYKNVKPRIIAEPFVGKDDQLPEDYKNSHSVVKSILSWFVQDGTARKERIISFMILRGTDCIINLRISKQVALFRSPQIWIRC